MKYYTVEDVMRITGTKQNKSYEIIRELNKKFKKEFPKSVSIQGQVMKWYFDKSMGIERKDKNEEN